MENIAPTTWQIGIVIVSSLIAVIGVLWKIFLNNHKEKELRIRKYEKQEKMFYTDMRVLSNKVSHLEGERKGHTKGIEQVVTAVTREIRASRREALELGKKLEKIRMSRLHRE